MKNIEAFGVWGDESLHDILAGVLSILNSDETNPNPKVEITRVGRINHPDFLVIKTETRRYEIQVYDTADRFAAFEECARLESLKLATATPLVEQSSLEPLAAATNS